MAIHPIVETFQLKVKHYGGITEKVRGWPESFGIHQVGTMSVKNVMAIHPVMLRYFSLGQSSGPTNRPTSPCLYVAETTWYISFELFLETVGSSFVSTECVHSCHLRSVCWWSSEAQGGETLRGVFTDGLFPYCITLLLLRALLIKGVTIKENGYIMEAPYDHGLKSTPQI